MNLDKIKEDFPKVLYILGALFIAVVLVKCMFKFIIS